MTLDPARPSPGAGEYPLESGNFDEAFADSGSPRPPYAELLGALAQQDLVALRERVRSNTAAAGLQFGPGREIPVDPVPRLIEAGEWEALEAGPAAAGAGAQRVRRRRLRRRSGSSTPGSCRGA